jgi:hypothetical protein
MTVSTAPTPLSYAGNGSTTAFPVTWKYNAKSHVVATLRSSAGAETVWVITTNYTLTDPGDTGTLTAVVAPATGETLVITLEPPNTQSSDIPLGGDFPSVTVEDGLDLAAQRDGKIEALFLRALRVPKTDTQTGSLLELPIDSDRASKFLAFNASGKPIAAAGTSADLGPVSVFINTLLDDITDAEARTTLAGESIGMSGDITLDSTYQGKSIKINSAGLNIHLPSASTLGNKFEVTLLGPATGSATLVRDDAANNISGVLADAKIEVNDIVIVRINNPATHYETRFLRKGATSAFDAHVFSAVGTGVTTSFDFAHGLVSTSSGNMRMGGAVLTSSGLYDAEMVIVDDFGYVVNVRAPSLASPVLGTPASGYLRIYVKNTNGSSRDITASFWVSVR